MSEHEKARELVLRYGWNATSHQILNPGIQRWFSRGGDAVIGYVEASGFLVVAGSPICDTAELGDVISEWEAYAAGRRRKTCYFGAAGRVQTVLEASEKHSTVVLGSQPVWEPEHWAEVVDGHASLRAQLYRARNKGVTVSEWPPQRADEHPALQRCLDQWLETRGLPPLHFLVEPRTLSNMENRRVFVAERFGEVVAFVVLSPAALRKGWLTEQFPRGWGAPNGAIELAMDRAIRTVASEGAQYVTMGLVPLSFHESAPESANPRWLRVLLAFVRAAGRRFYNFAGLESFKSKFLPDFWEPIYVISNEERFSPRCLYAIGAAFAEGSPVRAIARGSIKMARKQWRRIPDRF